ncbi:MAG: MBL fold metallo-hydrolase [archaeon]
MFSHKGNLRFKDLSIDPTRSPKGEDVLISHAHADHVKLSKKSKFYSTPETIELIKLRYGEATFGELKIGKETKFDGFSVTPYPNGHILGSFQSKFSSDGTDYACTSDFRLKDSLLFKGAEPIKCDTLVLETTFGSPEYAFEPYDNIVSEMTNWVKENAKKGLVLLAGYSLGKAQELTRISNDAGLVPVVHESIFASNKIYNSFGIKLGEYLRLNHNLKDASVLIMPPQLVDRHLFATIEHFDKRKVFSAVASGWDYKGYYDKVFHLSNHADYNDLFAYVEAAKPKLILTDHGFADEFARKLNRKGFNAKPLAHHKQRVLGEF